MICLSLTDSQTAVVGPCGLCVPCAVSEIRDVWKVCDVLQRLQSPRHHQSQSVMAADDVTSGILFAFISSFDVDSASSASFIVRRWSVSPVRRSDVVT